MRNDAHSAEPGHVFCHVAGLPAERIRGLWEVDCDEVPATRTDFDGIHAQHSLTIRRRFGSSGSVAVVSENNKAKVCASGRGGNLLDRPAPVGSIRVHVERATHDRAGDTLPARGFHTSLPRRQCGQGKKAKWRPEEPPLRSRSLSFRRGETWTESRIRYVPSCHEFWYSSCSFVMLSIVTPIERNFSRAIS